MFSLLFRPNKPINKVKINKNNNTILFPLAALSKQMRQEDIFPNLLPSATTLGFLARTSKQLKEETAFLRLLAASVHAAPEFMDAKEDARALASIAILKKELKENPELLFRKKMVTDHYGREIWASPYQIFLGTGDIWALRQIQKEILHLVKNGEAQAEAQFKEQFPNCPWPLPEDFSEEMLYDDRNKHQITKITEQLTILKKLLDLDPFINKEPEILDATRQAAETLYKLFKPKPGEIIRSGLHFPIGIMKIIYNTYKALPLSSFFYFTLAVIKPALEALSSVDGQCCQIGVRDLDMEKGPNRRCDSAYKHPLGQPLCVTRVYHEYRGVATIIDPFDGVVLFVSSAFLGEFKSFRKNGEQWVERRGVALQGIGNLMENKSRCLWELFGQTQISQHLSQDMF